MRGALLALLLLAAPGEPASASQAYRGDFWKNQRARWFVAPQLSSGALQAARVAVGRGRPEWVWGGASGNAVLTTDFASLSLGPQINWLGINALVRYERIWPHVRRMAAVAPRYERSSFRDREQAAAHSSNLHGSIWGFVPAGPTLGLWGITVQHFLHQPDKRAIFSETLRFTVERPWAYMPQLAWWRQWQDGRYLIGPAADAVLSPGRPGLWRLGAAAVLKFSHHLSLEAWLTLPVSSPDKISWLTQSWGSVHLRWVTATGLPKARGVF